MNKKLSYYLVLGFFEATSLVLGVLVALLIFDNYTKYSSMFITPGVLIVFGALCLINALKNMIKKMGELD